MKALISVIGALFLVTTACAVDAPKEPDPWRILSPSGKGVCIVKVKTDEGPSFVFFPGTNGPRSTSTLKVAGVAFPSLYEAVAFLWKKPSGVIAFTAPPNAVNDDAKILLVLSEAELKALAQAGMK